MALTERTTAPVRRGPPGHGPVHSLAETPDGAWAEFIRHEQCAEAPTEVMVRVRTRCGPVLCPGGLSTAANAARGRVSLACLAFGDL